MEFEVLNSSDMCVMATTYENCIPYEYIDSMIAANYRFKLDGKFLSKTKLSEIVRSRSVLHSSLCCDGEVKRKSKVRCIDTGKLYDTQSEAARDLKIDPAQVSDSIKTGRPRSGYTFEKVTF